MADRQIFLKLPTPLIAKTCGVFLNASMITEIKKINNLQ